MSTSIPYRLGRLYGRLPTAGKFSILMTTGICLVWFFSSKEPPVSNPTPPAGATVAGPVPKNSYDPVAKWGQSKVDAATKVMDLVQEDCVIYEEGSHLVVEMKTYIDSPDQRLAYMRTIADTDVILHGSPRNIFFYDPANRKIGQADTLNGVRLVD